MAAFVAVNPKFHGLRHPRDKSRIENEEAWIRRAIVVQRAVKHRRSPATIQPRAIDDELTVGHNLPADMSSVLLDCRPAAGCRANGVGDHRSQQAGHGEGFAKAQKYSHAKPHFPRPASAGLIAKKARSITPLRSGMNHLYLWIADAERLFCNHAPSRATGIDDIAASKRRPNAPPRLHKNSCVRPSHS